MAAAADAAEDIRKSAAAFTDAEDLSISRHCDADLFKRIFVYRYFKPYPPPMRCIVPLSIAAALLVLVPHACALAFSAPAPISHDFKKPAFISFIPELGDDVMIVTSFDMMCSNCKLCVCSGR